MKPVVAIYSTFLQRAYDQLIHDVAIQNLPVVFALDRAGLVGADGATHAGAYDIAYLRCIPNMSVHGAGRRERMPPDAVPPRSSTTGPAAVRYPRGAGAGVGDRAGADGACRSARARSRARSGQQRIAILAFGTCCTPALAAGRGARRDGRQHALRQAARRRAGQQLARDARRPRDGGRGLRHGRRRRAVAEALAAAGIVKPVLMLGLPDEFIDHGDPAMLLAGVGLDAKGIAASIRQRFAVGEPRLVVNNS